MNHDDVNFIKKVATAANTAALDEHRRMGRSVPVMRDGKIVWLGPDEIGEVLEKRAAEAEPDSAELLE